jgi:hypothetical protein
MDLARLCEQLQSGRAVVTTSLQTAAPGNDFFACPVAAELPPSALTWYEYEHRGTQSQRGLGAQNKFDPRLQL